MSVSADSTISAAPSALGQASRLRRIALVNTHDLIGGAERCSYDLHTTLRERGYDTHLIVGGKYGTDADVFKIPFKEYEWRSARFLRRHVGLTEITHPTPLLGCYRWPFLRDAEVVNIHNMHGQFWNMLTLLPLARTRPVVLTLHDEYNLTGDCCYTGDCERWKKSCGKCPQAGHDKIARYAIGGRDLTRINVWIKRLIFRAPKRFPVVLVTPAEWLAKRTRQSPNLRHLPVQCIPNGIDLHFWKPDPQSESRQTWNLPLNKKIGLISAMNLDDPRKGTDVALAAIRQLPEDCGMHFLLVGKLNDQIKRLTDGLPVTLYGMVTDKRQMVQLYSAADFTMVISRADNLPYMCLESLACGRPVFGSAVGGIPEIVDDPGLGWLTPMPLEVTAIARTLRQIAAMSREALWKQFAACRRSAEVRYSVDTMVDRYLALFHRLHEQACCTKHGIPDRV